MMEQSRSHMECSLAQSLSNSSTELSQTNMVQNLVVTIMAKVCRKAAAIILTKVQQTITMLVIKVHS